MSELKEHYYYEDRVVTPATHMYRVYHADEADKVIAEKDKEIMELKGHVNGFKNRSNLWHYNAQNEHNAAIAERMENAKLKAKLAEKDKEIAKLKEQYKDMDVTHTVHIAKMNALIEELEENVDFWKKENRRLKRALWIAHAYKAKFKRWWLHLALDYEASMIRPDTKTIKRIKGKIENCEKSERKCRAKAEDT